MRMITRFITLWILIFSVGCQANSIDTETPLDNMSSPAAPPKEGDITQMPTSIPTPVDAGLQDLIKKAKTDLAQRLSISITQISLVEATEVEWSDSSLDCPQPGMDYLQAITPGYRILLEADGKEYEYHSNRDTYVVYCEDPVPPFLPKP